MLKVMAFYGAYWACKDGSDCAVIAMLGDDPRLYGALGGESGYSVSA